jgi:hypothetical protein
VVNETSRVTSELLWRGTGVALLIDIPLLLLVGRFVSSRVFRQLEWHVAAAAFLVYAALWGAFGSVYFWDSVYKAVFPTWSRWLLPPGFGLLFGAVAVAFWRVSCRATRWPAVWFVLLGGVVSLLGHGVGIRRGLLRVPLLSEASPASALVFGVFEFIFYWCGIVALAVAARKLGPALRHAHP